MNSPAATIKPERIYDLDWMRIIGIIAIFIFHVSHYFGSGFWHVKNLVSSASIEYFGGFFIIWAMPLFFVISGISSNIILGFQKPAKFVKSRVLRLLIPFPG